jgi:hypothetical protein
MPQCLSTSPRAPSTTSPSYHHQFLSATVPLRAHRQPATPTISRPRPCLHEHHHTKEYFGTHFNFGSICFSGPSPVLPYADRHRCREPSSSDHLPIQPPNRFPLSSRKDAGPTFPSSPSLASPILAMGQKGQVGQTRQPSQAKYLCGLSPLQQCQFIFTFRIIQIQF